MLRFTASARCSSFGAPAKSVLPYLPAVSLSPFRQQSLGRCVKGSRGRQLRKIDASVDPCSLTSTDLLWLLELRKLPPVAVVDDMVKTYPDFVKSHAIG